ncbi:rhodanese [Pseudomonas lactis]|uniref:Rhodanese n=1 Tax=Pseudomonas lactis TaxID=1615674 RepID=A0A7Y1M7G3_9PSED|nr:rhodanese-like domain-containing protein [Pseudomonas lactis]NNA76452.1 rhodanese [Pseudomonas lactis]
MTQVQAINLISATDLHSALLHRSEIAVIDVREAKFYAQGHINLSAHFALSSLEPELLRAVPRRSVPLIIVDDEGAFGGEAERAIDVLSALSFTDIRMLEGGISAWKTNGLALGTGYNTLVKTFSDLAHSHYATPTITPQQLQTRLNSGQPTTIIDCRPEQEYQKTTVTGAYNVPGVELALYDLSRVDAEHLYVISCFSRTRGIVATTTLARLNDLPNVAFLEDGIMASFLYGLPTGPGDIRLPPPRYIESDLVLRRHAESIIQRHGLSVIDHRQYSRLLEERDARTLYVFDVRPEASYLAGHLEQAVSAPGGQLLMTYDAQVPVRNARIVLVDDPHLKRAAVSAYWLSHFNNADIHVLAVDQGDFNLVSGASTVALPENVRWLTPQDVHKRIDSLYVLDVGPSLNYEQGHLPGAKFVLRPSLPAWLETQPQGPFLFTSPDGVNAAYAASEFTHALGIEAYALKGGTEAWRKAGLALEVDFQPQQLISPFDDDWGSTMRAKVNREQIFRDYLTWERNLSHEIPQDETVQFHWPAVSNN